MLAQYQTAVIIASLRSAIIRPSTICFERSNCGNSGRWTSEDLKKQTV